MHSRSSAVGHLLASLCDQLTLGILIIDGQRRLVTSNRAGRRILEERDVLLLDGQRLRAAGEDDEQSLTAAIERVTEQDDADPLGYFRLEAELTEPIHGYTTCLATNPDGEVEAIAVVLYDPRHSTTSTERHLRRMFGLTAAEARVGALIAEGVQVAEVAQTLRISIHTVRTQLKNIFAKAGVSRQSELVRLATSGLALIAERDETAKSGTRASRGKRRG